MNDEEISRRSFLTRGTGFVLVAATGSSTTMSLTVPESPTGQNLSGTVHLSVDVRPTPQRGVQFYVDGATLGAPVMAAPYVIPWDTTKYPAGSTHVLKAVAMYKTRTYTATLAVTVASSASASGGGSSLAPLYAIYDGFAATRTRTANTSAEFAAIIGTIATGDDIYVNPMTLTGQWQISDQPASYARITFASGVSFTGGAVGSGVVVALLLSGAKNLWLRGPADVTNLGHDGVRINNGTQNCVLQGIRSHGCGIQNFLIQHETGESSSPTNVWFDGIESTNGGRSDAATNVGIGNYYLSGTHGVYWGDGVTNGGIINSWIHDQHNGHGVQIYQGNLAGSGSIFAFNTIIRCDGAGRGIEQAASGLYFFDGGSNQKAIGNILKDELVSGLNSHATSSSVGQGNVFFGSPSGVTQEDTGPYLTVTDSHSLDPVLDASDRPGSSSPIKDLASAYRSTYLPRLDRAGNIRYTSDPGCYAAP